MFDEDSLSDFNIDVNISGTTNNNNVIKLSNKPNPSIFLNKSLTIATFFRNNITLEFAGNRNTLCYPTRYDAVTGHYDFLDNSMQGYTRENRTELLIRHYPNEFQLKNGRPDDKAIRSRIVVGYPVFKPYQPTLTEDQNIGKLYINTWSPPYIWQVKHNKVPQPKSRICPKGQLPHVYDLLFCSLLDSPNEVKAWIKATLTGRPQLALFLGGTSRSGKSLLGNLIALLHGKNAHTSYTIKQFADKPYSRGALRNKTITVLNEGVIESHQLEVFKTFINSDTIDAEIKYEQNVSSTNYSSLIICTDKHDALKASDLALRNRLLIPQTNSNLFQAGTLVKKSDGAMHYITQEEIETLLRIVRYPDSEESKTHTLALAEHLEAFDASAIELNNRAITGFRQLEQDHENFFSSLVVWERKFLIDYIMDYCIKLIVADDDNYSIPFKEIKELIYRANNDASMRQAFLMSDKTTKISQTNIYDLGRRNATIIKCSREHGVKDFSMEVNAEFVRSYLTSQLSPKSSEGKDK